MWTNDGRILMFYAVLLRSALQWMMWCWDWTCWLLTSAWATGGFKTSTLNNILNQASVNGSFQYWKGLGNEVPAESLCKLPWLPNSYDALNSFHPVLSFVRLRPMLHLPQGPQRRRPCLVTQHLPGAGNRLAMDVMWEITPQKKTLNNNYNYI